MTALRSILADNPGPFTLEGTRTHILGRRQVAIVDPGPAVEAHVRAVALAVVEAEEVTVLLTHGHGDHSGGVDLLLDALAGSSGPIRVRGSGHRRAEPLDAGTRVSTDAGELVTILTPGHSRDHLAFHWPDGRALFAGDMVLGRGDTTWVAEYPGCVADYLDSLTRLEAMELDTIHPAHGPDLSDPRDALSRYRAHREARIERVRQILAEDPQMTARRVLDRVYGSGIPSGLIGAALASAEALVEHVTGNLRNGPGMTEPQA